MTMQPREMRRAWRQDIKRRAGQDRPRRGDREVCAGVSDRKVTETVETETLDRPVRVTLEGTCRVHWLTPNTMRFETADGMVMLLPASGDGITVEDIETPRTWTDGDVVQHSHAPWTLTREHGRWHNSHPATSPRDWDDEQVTKHLVDRNVGWGNLQVLRYQAGEC